MAFQAADAEAVQKFYDAAVGLGAESLHAPRLWPEYHPGYFGAFVRDPDGNNVEAVFHGGPDGNHSAGRRLVPGMSTPTVEARLTTPFGFDSTAAT